MKRAGFYYRQTPATYPCHAWFAQEYQQSVSPEFGLELKALDPAHISYNYKSATDTYTKKADGSPHVDGQRLAQICAGMGIGEETQYLHFDQDTVIEWTGGLIAYAAGERVEVYHAGNQGAGMTRHAHCFQFSAPMLAFWAHHLANRFTGSGYVPTAYDGIFFDNCANVLYNWGVRITSGGRVREAGQILGSSAFNAWHWANLRSALSAFKAQATKKVAINAGNAWTNEYFACTDVVVQEFVGNPIRDSWPSIATVRQRHIDAEAAGVEIWPMAAASDWYLGTPPETYQEMQYGSLCLFLAVCSGTSSHHIQDLSGPYRPDWPQRITSAAQAPAMHRLGAPTGEPELIPNTHIYRRMFGKPGGGGGAVYARIREPWNGRTDVIESFPRQPQMLLLGMDGQLTKPDVIEIKNGGGAILVRA